MHAELMLLLLEKAQLLLLQLHLSECTCRLRVLRLLCRPHRHRLRLHRWIEEVVVIEEREGRVLRQGGRWLVHGRSQWVESRLRVRTDRMVGDEEERWSRSCCHFQLQSTARALPQWGHTRVSHQSLRRSPHCCCTLRLPRRQPANRGGVRETLLVSLLDRSKAALLSHLFSLPINQQQHTQHSLAQHTIMADKVSERDRGQAKPAAAAAARQKQIRQIPSRQFRALWASAGLATRLTHRALLGGLASSIRAGASGGLWLTVWPLA